MPVAVGADADVERKLEVRTVLRAEGVVATVRLSVKALRLPLA